MEQLQISLLLDLETEEKINPETFLSKGKNTPFTGWECKGWPVITIVEGKIAWRKGTCNRMKRQLILEDGTIFIGEAFGSETSTSW